MKFLIIANWKANPSTQIEAKNILSGIKKGIKKNKKTELVVCPPFPYLSIFNSRDKKIILGAQDVFWQEGPFTGQVSTKMIKSFGCKYVILGHSEQRFLGETDETINRKIIASVSVKLSPILSIGETKKERMDSRTKKVLTEQLRKGLKTVSGAKLLNSKLVIAYEPVWAIGAKKPCSYDVALSANLLIRSILSRMYSQKIAQSMRILYGGSVNSKNIKGFITRSKMDGVIIGRASLKPKELIAILNEF